MKKRSASGWMGIYVLAIASLWTLIAVWALTEKEPPEGNGAYGNVMTLENQAAADLFGVDKPGIYVVNQNNKPVTALRGGLGMILRGDVTVGWRGLRRGLLRTTPGIVLSVLLGASLLGWIPLLALTRPRPA